LHPRIAHGRLDSPYYNLTVAHEDNTHGHAGEISNKNVDITFSAHDAFLE